MDSATVPQHNARCPTDSHGSMTILKWFLGVIVVCGGFVAVMYFAQRSLQYFPEKARLPPVAANFSEAEEIVLDTPDGEKIIVWHVAPREGRPVVLYMHGNGGSVFHRADRFRAITAEGNGLVAVSYRGFGGSTGSPSEAGLKIDAETAYRFAVSRYPAERIVAWGESLGTGVATTLASEHPVARLILDAPFTSAADVGAMVYWFLPVRLLMKDQFHSDERIGKVKVPLLVLHGVKDRVVPIAFGEKLFAMANEPKRMFRFPEGGHVNLDSHGAKEVWRAFLGEMVR
jgi:pimeloyl-ACP methyl ester carboxylesterase